MARAAQLRKTGPSASRGMMALATLWSGAMVVLGLKLAWEGAPFLVGKDLSVVLGWAGVAGGQFVFMVLVADRCFPRAARGMVLGIEALVLATFLTLIALAVWRVL